MICSICSMKGVSMQRNGSSFGSFWKPGKPVLNQTSGFNVAAKSSFKTEWKSGFKTINKYSFWNGEKSSFEKVWKSGFKTICKSNIKTGRESSLKTGRNPASKVRSGSWLVRGGKCRRPRKSSSKVVHESCLQLLSRGAVALDALPLLKQEWLGFTNHD